MKVIDRRKKAMGGNSLRDIKNIKNVAIHYSATKTGNTGSFENYWKSKGWKTGGYHEVVLLNGDVELNYNSNVITNGVKNHNSNTYHICYVGTSSPNEKQLNSLLERVKKVCRDLKIPFSNVRGHREFKGASTSCPKIDMGSFRSRLNKNTNVKKSDSNKVNKSINSMAKEIIDGKHGNGHSNRMKSLGVSKSEYEKVRKEVNKILKGTSNNEKRINKMAKEVIDGKHGNGHSNRMKSLGISKSEYEKVRREVNRLMK